MRIIYETESCSRCGGCGEYSYNLMHGSRCFKCHGKGTQLTRAAKRAQKRIDEFKEEHYHKLATDLEVGDQIYMRDGCWRRVLEISDSGTYGTFDRGDGNGPQKNYYIDVKTQKVTYSITKTQLVDVRPTSEQFREELVPFARRFKGVTIED